MILTKREKEIWDNHIEKSQNDIYLPMPPVFEKKLLRILRNMDIDDRKKENDRLVKEGIANIIKMLS